MEVDKFPLGISVFKVISKPFVLVTPLFIILVGIQNDKMTVAIIKRIPRFIIRKREEVKVISGISLMVAQARKDGNMVNDIAKWLKEERFPLVILRAIAD